MRFKKLISIVLILAMLCQGAIMPLAAEQTGYDKEIEIIKAFKIMVGDEKGNFNANDNLTRAEFAKVLTVMLKLTDGQKISSEKIQKFDDVTAEHWAFEAISKITDIGYMIGTGEKEFSPEDYVTINQVNKVLVKLLGYEAFAIRNGGYPVGYNYTASSIKLLKGINHYGETPILRGELAKMLCNMFDVEIVEIGHITDEGTTTYQQSKNTFLEENLEIFKGEGVIIQNTVTSLYGSTDVSENEVVINNELYGFTKETEYINDFIGKKIEFFYKKDDNNKKVIIYATLSDDTDELVIDIKDFVTIGNGKLKYYENDEIEEIDIELMPDVIYNGTQSETISDEMIKKYNNGTISAIRTDGKGVYDLIKVDGYRTMFVKNVAEGVIVDGLIKQGTESATLDLSEINNKNKTVSFYNEGAKGSLKDITVNSVIDVAESDKEIKVKITKNILKCVVVGITDDIDGYFVYDADGKSYRLAQDYINSTTVALPDAGKEYELFLNSFGEVSYAKASSVEYNNIGLVIRAFEDGRGLNKLAKVKVMGTTGRFDEYLFAEKVTYVNGNDEISKLKTTSEILNVLNSMKEKIITYKTDENGKISAICEPVAYSNNQARNVGRLGVLYETNSEFQYVGQNINCRAYLTSETVVFNISSSNDVEDELKYRVLTRTELGAIPELKISRVVAYNKDKNTPETEILLAYNENNVTYRPHISKIDLFVVDKVKMAVNADGDNTVVLEGAFIAGNSQAQPKIQTFKSSCGAFSRMGAFVGTEGNYTVQKGDIIRCFEVDGDVKYATLVYRRSLDYNANGRYEKGAFAGINDGLMNSSGNSNPFAPRFTTNSFNVDGFVIWYGSTYANAGSYKELRFADMFVLSVNERFITLTTQDLSDPSSIPDYYNDKYTIITAPIPNYLTIQTKKGDNYVSANGLFTQIKSYDTHLSGCSRAIVQLYNGLLKTLVVLNEE